MARHLRIALGWLLSLAVCATHANALTYEPTALGWSAREVEEATSIQMTALVQRAAAAQHLGCSRHCERLDRIFSSLVVQARQQSARGEALPWSLTVVQLADVEAMAMPDGKVVISEHFIDERQASDEALAFILAHEMAHSILEHQRQALTYARMLLPRAVVRTVPDMYTEMDYNFGLLKAMEPVLQQGEIDADELGFLLASASGYDPERQLEFIEWEAAHEAGSKPLVLTHPAASVRLETLRSRLPLARRLVPMGQNR